MIETLSIGMGIGFLFAIGGLIAPHIAIPSAFLSVSFLTIAYLTEIRVAVVSFSVLAALFILAVIIPDRWAHDPN
jgi:hypothetical protein